MTKYIDKDISYLQFNQRVIDIMLNSESREEAIKYATIAKSNLEEFISVTLSKRKEDNIKKECYAEINKQYFTVELYMDKLSNINIYITNDDIPELNRIFYNICNSFGFYKVNKKENFPYIKNKEIGFLVKTKEDNYIITIPRKLNTIWYSEKNKCNYHIIDILKYSINEYLNITYEKIIGFRILRNLVDKDEDKIDTIEYIDNMEYRLNKRKQGEIELIEITASDTPDNIGIVSKLKNLLNIVDNYKVIFNVGHLKMNDLLKTNSMFIDNPYYRNIRENETILQHPYDSADGIIEFLNKAATDKNVISIKQTVYRLSKNSPLMNALLTAIKNDIDVTVVFEIRARFDERNNIYWAKRIKEAGGNVVFGARDKKKHCKTIIVNRLENNKIVSYCHIGTCNYNELKNTYFSDISYFTADSRITNDISKLFINIMTGNHIKYDYILSGPKIMKDNIIQKIDNEIKYAKEGKPARIIIKINGLEDLTIIDKLYEASIAGVSIDLLVRGICSLRTDQKYSQNITVRSIMGHNLEHSRMYYFENDVHKLYIATADLMKRNLERRYEFIVPLLNENSYKLVLRMLELYMGNCNRYELHDQKYIYVRGKYDVQQYFDNTNTKELLNDRTM